MDAVTDYPLVDTRASSLSTLFDCPARWKAVHIDKLWRPTGGAAWLGTSLHRSTAAFDQARLSGDTVTADDTAGVFVDALHSPDEEVEWNDDINPKKVEPIGLALHARYCTEIAPAKQYVAVEATCEAMEVSFPEHHITLRLTGTADRVQKRAEGLGISDLKSGKRAVGADGRVATKGHALQLGVYELLAESVIGEPLTAPAEIIGLQTNSKARVATGDVISARDALIGTEEAPGALNYAAAIISSGAFYGNPRSPLCSPKYCPAWDLCRFRDR